MISVLLLVFLLQLVIHVVNSLGAQTINDVLWRIYTKLPTPQGKDAAQSAKLRQEVIRLNREMNATSAQDDFAKWARLRREHDKKKEQYEKTSRTTQDFQANFNRIMSALRWLSTQGLQFTCNFWYSKQPMFWIPRGWVPYQVEWILSFPSAPLGGISVNVWALACASVIGMVSEGVRATWTLREGRAIEGKNKGEKIKTEPMTGQERKKEL